MRSNLSKRASLPGQISQTWIGRPLPAPGFGRREERLLAQCEAMIDIVAALFNVSGKDLRRSGKTGAGVTRVRQVAMYVCHVALGLTMAEVGKGFGRERTTVLYACHLIEDLRDDADFDRIVGLVERVAHAAFRNREVLVHAG